MIVLYVMGLAVYFLLFIWLRRKGVSISEYLYTYGNKKKFFRPETVRESLQILEPGNWKTENMQIQKYYVGKIKRLLQMILIGDVLALLLCVSAQMDRMLTDGRYIERNPYGMGSVDMNLQAQITEPDGIQSEQNFTLTVEERQYEEAVVRQMAEELTELLPHLILGSNVSLESVRNDLELIQEVEGYPFRLEWECDNYTYIDSDGHVINEEIEKEGAVVNLTVIIVYEAYREEFVIPIHILPAQYSAEEQFRRKVYQLLAKEQQDSSNEYVELPLEVEGRTISWREETDDVSGIIFILLCVAAALVYLVKDRELQERIEKRNKQLLLDYPQLISKVTLYLGAGMTIRNIFQKIALDYQKEKEAGGEVRYVYEEMLLTCHELESGISEAVAYEHFGKRCRLMQYMKFTNLLVQNLRKGSNTILDALRQEGKSAFEERKNTARRLGEEAGTKLLMPMMLMLGIVMILIIIPAYFSFSV